MAGKLIRGVTFDEALDIALTQRQINVAGGRKPSVSSRREVENAFHEAFELVGGVTRLAIWANDEKNYGQFITLYSKLMPKEVDEKIKETFVYVSNIPQSALNRPAATTRIDEDVVDEA